MTFYILVDGNAIIGDVQDEMTASFKTKNGWEDDLVEVTNSLQELLDHKLPTYTRNRLRYFFPGIREASETEYHAAEQDIEKFNVEQKKMAEEVEGTSLSDIQTYLVTFPSIHPEIISYAELRTLSRTVASAVQGLDVADGPVDASDETLRLIYSIVLAAERSGDRSMIKEFSELSDVDDEAFTPFDDTDEEDEDFLV